MPGDELPPQPHSAHCFPLIIIPQTLKFFLYKPIIKLHIVTNKNSIPGHFNNTSGYFVKFGSIAHHFIANSGQLCNKQGNITFRIYEAGKRIDNFDTIMNKNSNLGNLSF